MNLDFTQEKRTQFPLIPEDTYQAVLCDVEDLGLKQGQYDLDGAVPKVKLHFQTEPITMVIDGEEVTKRYFLSTFDLKVSKDDRSTYYKAFQALMGGKIDPNVKSSDDLVGNNVNLDIVHKKSKDGENTYVNIGAISKVKSNKLRELEVEGYQKKEKKNSDDWNDADPKF